MHKVLNNRKERGTRGREQRTGGREEKTGKNKTIATGRQGRSHRVVRSFGDPTWIAEG